MKKVLLILVLTILLLILCVIIIGFSLYREGLKALPGDIQTIQTNTQHPERVYDVFWCELGGTGSINMQSIVFELFRYLVINDAKVPASLKLCETTTSLLVQRQGNHKKEHYSNLELKAITVWLNRNWTARQALGFIADQSYFGHEAVGVTEASWIYFRKPLGELNVEETTVLAAITFKPSVYDPWCNPENSLQRTNSILEKLHLAMPGKYPLKQLGQLPDTLLPAPYGTCVNRKPTQ